MEIHSKKIDTDVLHVVQTPDDTILVEGWGPAGIDKILKTVIDEDNLDQLISVEAIAAFYRKVQDDLPDVEEMRVTLGNLDIHNITLRHEDGRVEHHPNRYCFYES